MKDDYLNAARPLKEQIGLKSKQEKLNSHELTQLLEMQEDILISEKDKTSVNPYVSLVASLFIAVMIAAFMWQGTEGQQIQSIAGEVAGNHIKQRPMELHTHSMDKVRSHFRELDFLPSNSDRLREQFALAETDLIGARYCSIKGITAAQLRYKEPRGKHSTLYEVGYDSNVYGSIPDIDTGEEPETVMIKGLKVSLWVEKGLLMALVEDI